MAKKFNTTTSEDALTIHVKGDKRNPEPGSLIVLFPGGHIELTRCTDGTYWAHIAREVGNEKQKGEIIDSRIDYTPEAYAVHRNIPSIPAHEEIQHIAVRIAVSKGGAA